MAIMYSTPHPRKGTTGLPLLAANKKRAHDTPEAQAEDAMRLAEAIHRAGMSGTARVAIEAFKPLHWIVGQFAWALEPFLGTFGSPAKTGEGASHIGTLAGLLEREDGITTLDSHLDALSKKSMENKE